MGEQLHAHRRRTRILSKVVERQQKCVKVSIARFEARRPLMLHEYTKKVCGVALVKQLLLATASRRKCENVRALRLRETPSLCASTTLRRGWRATVPACLSKSERLPTEMEGCGRRVTSDRGPETLSSLEGEERGRARLAQKQACSRESLESQGVVVHHIKHTKSRHVRAWVSIIFADAATPLRHDDSGRPARLSSLLRNGRRA